MKAKKNLIVVGDRVLVEPEDGSDKTTSGLYLPDTVKEKQKVVGGYVVKVGPGYPVHDPHTSQEPWVDRTKKEIKYVPLQANEGLCNFHQKICQNRTEGKNIDRPHSAILALAH
jgi:co-chaperonin GroES (HSP10)